MKNKGEVSTPTSNSSDFVSFCKKIIFPSGKPPLKEENKLSPCVSRSPSESDDQSLRTPYDDNIKRVFSYFDENDDGKVSPAELRKSVRALGGELSEEDAEMAVRLSDSDGDGMLGLEDFAKLISLEAAEGGGEEGKREEELREAFRMYEMKGTGCIKPESLRRMLSRLGESTTVENCRAMIGKFDLDGDGVLNFDEFKIMMR